MADQYSHIWSTRLGNRLRLLTCRLEEVEGQIAALFDHAQRETETIRNVDPDASEVPVNGSEYRAYLKEQRALIHEIADQTGQLSARVGKIEVAAGNPITEFTGVIEDESGNLFGLKMSIRPGWGAKRWRIKQRFADGAVELETVTASGSSLMTVSAQGIKFEHAVIGVCFPCIEAVREGKPHCDWPDCSHPLQKRSQAPLPAPERGQPASPAREAPVFEPPLPPSLQPARKAAVKAPLPEPVSELVRTSAFQIARWVRGAGNHVPLRQLSPGRNISPADEDLAYAIAMQWVVINGDLISAGPVSPVPVMPVVERSPRERALAWGPIVGRDW